MHVINAPAIKINFSFQIQLWLALADQHFQLKEIDWEKGQQKCMCDQSLDDNEELGIQIVKVN